MREIELKLLLTPEQAGAVLRAPTLKDRAGGRRRTRTLVSRYFDTADHALRKRGIALRLRQAGRDWVQTVKKAKGAIVQGLSTPLEDECAVPAPDLQLTLIANDDLREEVIGLARKGLSVVAETRFERTSVELGLPGGGRAEVAVDRGTVAAGDLSAPLAELELELIEGDPAALYALAAELLTAGPVRFAETSKAERAMALMDGGPAPLTAVKAGDVDLSDAETVEAAAAAFLAECLGHYLPNVAVLLDSDDPDGPHQVRVALRRLRSGLQAFRPALGAEAVATWADQARDIGARVGPLRDLDVLTSELIAPLAERAPDDAGLTALLEALAARRAAVKAALAADLAGPEVTRFGLGFAGWLAGRGWRAAPDVHEKRLAGAPSAFAVKALDKRWAAVSAFGARLETLTVEERHEMRKALKKLRYVVDAFHSLFARKAVDKFVARLKDLQTAFGALNDSAMAEAILLAPDAPGRDDPAMARAVGRVVGHLSAAADALWPEAMEDWRRLAKEGPFWR